MSSVSIVISERTHAPFVCNVKTGKSTEILIEGRFTVSGMRGRE